MLDEKWLKINVMISFFWAKIITVVQIEKDQERIFWQNLSAILTESVETDSYRLDWRT